MRFARYRASAAPAVAGTWAGLCDGWAALVPLVFLQREWSHPVLGVRVPVNAFSRSCLAAGKLCVQAAYRGRGEGWPRGDHQNRMPRATQFRREPRQPARLEAELGKAGTAGGLAPRIPSEITGKDGKTTTVSHIY